MEKVSHRVEEIEFKEVGEIEGVDNQGLDNEKVENGEIAGGIAGGIEFPTLLHRNIYNAISLNPKIKLT
jgi:hypothetical protein